MTAAVFTAINCVALAAILWGLGDAVYKIGYLDAWVECHATVTGRPR